MNIICIFSISIIMLFTSGFLIVLPAMEHIPGYRFTNILPDWQLLLQELTICGFSQINLRESITIIGI